MNKLSSALLSIVVCAYLAGCGGTGAGFAPVINKSPNRFIPPTITVVKGDTLYGIAWKFGLDYQKVAKLNALKKPYVLRAGHTLRLRLPGKSTALATPPKVPATTAAQTKKPAPVTVAQTKKPARVAAAQKSIRLSAHAPKKWRWPAKGKLIRKFSPNQGHNGIRIAGTQGSAIRATASGKVVYSGEGLRGYGKLIIIKHSASYLSAYAHNRRIMVKEGQGISAGQQIAQMGKSDAGRTMLHFEIRKNGKPVNPLKFLK